MPANRRANPKGQPPIQLWAAYRAPWLLPLDREDLRAALRAMLAAVNAPREKNIAALDVHLVSDAGISRANRRFLRCPGPTNILSFPGGDGLPGILLLSLDTFDRECLLYGQERAAYLLRLLAHGLGHLAGLEHGPEMDALCAGAARAGLAALAQNF